MIHNKNQNYICCIVLVKYKWLKEKYLCIDYQIHELIMSCKQETLDQRHIQDGKVNPLELLLQWI